MIRVHYHPTDLQDQGEVEELDADEFTIEDDNSVRLYEVWEDDEGKKKKRTIGFIHPHRWCSVIHTDLDREKS